LPARWSLMDPVRRAVVHTGLTVKILGRPHGALVRSGCRQSPAWHARVPCGGSVMRVKITDARTSIRMKK
jgi:hypothetical protein